MSEPGLSRVKHVIMVLSGKGGVGKSTVAVQMARGFEAMGKRVGVLDIDLCGPSVPALLGLKGEAIRTTAAGQWVPVYAAPPSSSMPVVSIGFLAGDDLDTPVIWRGPKKTAVIRAFFADVVWGELDVLVIDTPPGTSDEHIASCEFLMACERGKGRPDGAVIVTTPQHVSVLDVRKELSFCQTVGLPVLGVFENMSGYVCPHCSTCTNIFSSEGGRTLAGQANVPFLGKLPIDPALCAAEELGRNPFLSSPIPLSLEPILAFCRSFFSEP